MTAPPVATGRVAHIDTAAISGQTAWRAGLGVSRGAQIIKLEGADREGRRWRVTKGENGADMCVQKVQMRKGQEQREEEEGR